MSAHKYSESRRAYKYVMLLSNFWDGLSHSSEKWLRELELFREICYPIFCCTRLLHWLLLHLISAGLVVFLSRKWLTYAEDKWTNLHLGWRSGESARLPPMCPGIDSRSRHHMWVEFVAGSLLCSERFFPGYSAFPLSSKTNISKFQF